MNYIVTIGIEVHVQLLTRTKMFCSCKAEFGAPPNTYVCPVCLGYPGALPVINEEAIRLTIMTGLLLGSTINKESKFDRKNYFYPDMPKNYQISQYDKPLCIGGQLEIECEGKKKIIHLTRIHLEEDVGKLIHSGQVSLIDFNRAGLPLMEIVTEPELNSPEEAFAFLLALKQILRYGEISKCNLEEGNMRSDLNCSIRPEGQNSLGIKTEIKNLNTFKGVYQALKHETARQIDVLGRKGKIEQETRRWDKEHGITIPMRSKEDAHDYRYFADPDLLPVVITQQQIKQWKSMLPEMPAERCKRLEQDYSIPRYDAKVLSSDKKTADYFEETLRYCSNAKAVSNWLMTEMQHKLSEKELNIEDAKITPEALACLVKLVDSDTINSTTAKEIFGILFEQGGNPARIIKQHDLSQISDAGAIEQMVDNAISKNPKSAADFKAGKKVALQFLIGQVMRSSKGKANPKLVRDLFLKKL